MQHLEKKYEDINTEYTYLSFNLVALYSPWHYLIWNEMIFLIYFKVRFTSPSRKLMLPYLVSYYFQDSGIGERFLQPVGRLEWSSGRYQ